jgi:hypothetical protein
MIVQSELKTVRGTFLCYTLKGLRVNNYSQAASTKVEPVKFYLNPEDNREIIRKENRDKAGIYLIPNTFGEGDTG